MSTTMDRNRLWAKRWSGDGDVPAGAYLPGHLDDVYRAAVQVLDATAEAQLQSLGLAPKPWLDRFRRIVTVASALHDLGKCNDQFQFMLKDGTRQSLRHEWATLLILDHGDWRKWLVLAVAEDETDWDIVRWCIAGHHPRYDRSAPPELADGPTRMLLQLDHDDMRETVRWLRETFKLGEPPQLADRVIDFRIGGSEELDDLYRRHYEAEDAYDNFSHDLRRLIAAAKDCLVASDVAGSALPREIGNQAERSSWIPTVFDMRTLPDSSDFRKIVASRLKCHPAEVDDKLRRFQRNAANRSRRVTFVKAGCGTGKTLAAYRWAERWCAGRRLYISYPTAGRPMPSSEVSMCRRP